MVWTLTGTERPKTADVTNRRRSTTGLASTGVREVGLTKPDIHDSDESRGQSLGLKMGLLPVG